MDRPSQLDAATVSHHRVEGLNGFIRRVFFPQFPPTECIDGLIWFPGGTGPFIPIPCDEGPLPRPAEIPAPGRFVRRPGTALAGVVAEQAGVSRAEAARVLAQAADVSQSELARMTVEDVGKAVVRNAGRTLRATADASFGSQVKELASYTDAIKPSSAIADVARQTGLEPHRLRALPVDELPDHLDVLGDAGAPAFARSTGTTVCASSGGVTQCGLLTGMAEKMLWGGIVGGVIGGGIGAAIGAAIGALIDWLF